MSEPRKHPTPPYASFSAFMNFVNKLKETTVPGRIDASVFGNASGSLSYSIMAALKSLKMIGADGVPTLDFISFVNADDEARKEAMLKALPEAFPTLWATSFKLETATAGQFDEHLRENYDVKGSTVDKVATFFIAAANYAGLVLSSHLKARKPTASSSSSRKSSKQRRVENDDPPPPPPKPGIETLDLDPLLIAILRRIPSKAAGWPREQRLRWFRTFAMNVTQVYDEPAEAVDLDIEFAATGAGKPATAA